MAHKIAITVQEDKGRLSPIDPRFGRARAFLILHEDDTPDEYILNTQIHASHGAGTGSAALMGERGVQQVISGEFGPKAFQALGALDIEMFLVEEGLTVAEALERHGRGELVHKQLSVFR